MKFFLFKIIELGWLFCIQESGVVHFVCIDLDNRYDKMYQMKIIFWANFQTIALSTVLLNQWLANYQGLP